MTLKHRLGTESTGNLRKSGVDGNSVVQDLNNPALCSHVACIEAMGRSERGSMACPDCGVMCGWATYPDPLGVWKHV